MARITQELLRRAFDDYCAAYARVGLSTEIWIDSSTPEYQSTALDLILEMPSQYQSGKIVVSPWHNPDDPQRWSGASAHYKPAGIDYLGDTMRECYRTLRAATATLYAVANVRGASLAPRHVRAFDYLNRSA